MYDVQVENLKVDSCDLERILSPIFIWIQFANPENLIILKRLRKLHGFESKFSLQLFINVMLLPSPLLIEYLLKFAVVWKGVHLLK